MPAPPAPPNAARCSKANDLGKDRKQPLLLHKTTAAYTTMPARFKSTASAMAQRHGYHYPRSGSHISIRVGDLEDLLQSLGGGVGHGPHSLPHLAALPLTSVINQAGRSSTLAQQSHLVQQTSTALPQETLCESTNIGIDPENCSDERSPCMPIWSRRRSRTRKRSWRRCGMRRCISSFRKEELMRRRHRSPLPSRDSLNTRRSQVQKAADQAMARRLGGGFPRVCWVACEDLTMALLPLECGEEMQEARSRQKRHGMRHCIFDHCLQ